jgi:Homeodomain-like domain
MTFRISPNQREMIIRLLKEGETRKNIARKCGVSEGTVSNITEEWKRSIGQGDAEIIRDFVISLKRIGVDISQCVEGFRTYVLLKNLGVEDEEELTSFISRLYNNCRSTIEDTHQEKAIKPNTDVSKSGRVFTPDDIASCFREFLLSLGMTNVKFADLPEYIKKTTTQYKKIKKELSVITQQHSIFVRRMLHAEENSVAALEKEKVTFLSLERYLEMKKELAKFDLDVDSDLSRLVDTLKTLGNTFGFDVERIIVEFQDINIQYIRKKHLTRELYEKEQRLNSLNQTHLILEQRVNMHTHLLNVYRNIESLGFGLAQLKIFKNFIEEIAGENEISSDLLMKQIFKRIESQIWPRDLGIRRPLGGR